MRYAHAARTAVSCQLSAVSYHANQRSVVNKLGVLVRLVENPCSFY
ncbi:MAG: hypothetical protein F6K56_10065 [Moorea sp. SIO3G5]|nr:hypothetical protein [Moorena sp. SIO3G5]